MSLTLSGDGTLTGVDADASGLLSELGGIGSNVVSAIKTDTFSTTERSFTPITDLSVTITPTSATSKILLVWFVAVSRENTTAASRVGVISVFRDSTNLCDPDSPSNRAPAFYGFNNTDNDYTIYPASGTLLDSPATTSAVTYTVQGYSLVEGTLYVNRTHTDTNFGGSTRSNSSIVAIEVAA